METREAIFKLRKCHHLSQDGFAEKLSVTRQAVSRWENGETLPNTDMLKLIAKTFGVTVDFLLGEPAGQCQSCGMRLEKDSDKGTHSDGSKSQEYCAFCYQRGAYTRDVTMEEMVELNVQALDEWNEAEGQHFTQAQARALLMEFLPTLKRWKSD